MRNVPFSTSPGSHENEDGNVWDEPCYVYGYGHRHVPVCPSLSRTHITGVKMVSPGKDNSQASKEKIHRGLTQRRQILVPPGIVPASFQNEEICELGYLWA